MLPGGDGGPVVVATWVLLGYLVLGTVMNGISRSPLERAVMTPATAVLAVGVLLVASGERRGAPLRRTFLDSFKITGMLEP